MNASRSCRAGAARLWVVAGLLLGAAARADVTEYEIGRYVSYTQTSSAPPVNPETWTLIAVVVVDTADEMVSAQLSFDRPPPVSYEMMVANAYIRQYLAVYYTDAASFLLDYPATTYTTTVDLGAGLESGDLFLPEGLYCPQIPALTGDTFDRLQGCDTALAFDGTINGFTLAPGMTDGSTNVTVIQVGEPAAAWSITLDPAETQFHIPAGLLLPATEYTIGVSYANSVRTPNAGFGTATSAAAYTRGSGAAFTTGPAIPPACTCDVNGDGGADTTDVLDLADAIASGNPVPNPSACTDFNQDGGADLTDVLDLAGAVAGGTCP